MPPVLQSKSKLWAPTELGDATVASFEQELNALLSQAPQVIELDCSLLGRVISGHINLLWQVKSKCQQAGTSLCLSGPSPALVRVLYLLDLADQFVIADEDASYRSRTDKDVVLRDLPLQYSEQIAPDSVSIEDALARFTECLRRIGVGATTQIELRTIAYEVLTNIRLHSGVRPPDFVSLEVAADWDKICLTFRDRGMPFDPRDRDERLDPLTASKCGQRRGFGLSMVRKLSNRVEYKRSVEAENILQITKEWYQ